MQIIGDENRIICRNLQINLHMSEKSSNFAAYFAVKRRNGNVTRYYIRKSENIKETAIWN